MIRHLSARTKGLRRKSILKWIIPGLFVALLIYLGTSPLSMPGADEHVGSIADKYASEVGAGQRPPFINTDKGDLLLFVFAVGGAVAGFWLGYNWRDLFGKPYREDEPEESGQHRSEWEDG
ncbi:MAG: hypothetical protein QMC95_10990 [Desulfitobacteriaceae bacterium]|nr:hypothetical protein [Desulfitobacteriaceae bacterium]MDI6914736.1 hypothetical protein [Desulfitobacteriaceae bacterium]